MAGVKGGESTHGSNGNWAGSIPAGISGKRKQVVACGRLLRGRRPGPRLDRVLFRSSLGHVSRPSIAP